MATPTHVVYAVASGQPVYMGVAAGTPPPAPPPPPPAPSLTLTAPSTGVVGTAGDASVQNTGSSAANWALSATPTGLTATPSSGTVAAGATTSVSLAYANAATFALSLANNSGGAVVGSPRSITVSAAPSPPPPPAPAPSAAYRNGQDYLFNAITASSLPSRISGGTNLSLDQVGVERRYVDFAGWAWDNAGGDWIDAAQVRMGSTPWASINTPNNADPTTYSVNVTTALQQVQTTGRWNAWIVRKLSATPRVVAGRFNANAALRPRIDVTYVGGATATLACRVSAFMSTGSSQPSQSAPTMSMGPQNTGGWALEFDRPTAEVQSATLVFTVAEHWGGSSVIEFNLADPPMNTDPVTYGVATLHPLDQGLTTRAVVIGQHRYQDGSAYSDFVQAGALDTEAISSYSPELTGGSPDTNKYPHFGLGKWVGGSGFEAGGASLVDSSYTGEGFVPLAPGLGALRVRMDKHPGIADGVEGGQNGTAAANSFIMLPASRFGLQSRMFVRYYIRIGRTAGNGNPYRFSQADKMHVLKLGVPTWTDAAGKCSIGGAHRTRSGGNSGAAGGGHGWSIRHEFSDYWHSTDSPSAGGWIRSLSWYDYTKNPPGHNYGNNTDLPAGATDSRRFNGLAQRGGLGAVLYADRWYCIEEEIRLNSVGSVNPIDGRSWAADGEYRVWLDGRLCYQQTGLVMRSLPLQNDLPALWGAVREVGMAHLWFNWFHGGLTRNTVDRVVFIAALAYADERIGPLRVPQSAPAAGTITSAGSTNNIASVNPANDALANPNYPGTPPWDAPNGSDWTSMLDYGGAVFVPTLGAAGKYLMWASAGHSAIGACMWVAWDVATKTFERYGPRPLPTNNLYQYSAGTNPDPAGFDHTWGDWDGGWTGFPSAFRQPGIRVPEGSHTRASFTWRPGHKAGNVHGEVFTGWEATGVNSGTGIAGSHVYNVDATTWARAGSVRPNSGSKVGTLVYHERLDYFVCAHALFSTPAGHIDIAPGSTKVWTRRTMTSAGQVHEIDNTAFAWVDAAGASWHVIVWHRLSAASPPMTLFAVKVDDLVAGTATSWVALTVSAASYPTNASGLTGTVSWPRCPVNGAYYAVNRVSGSNKLWKLAPPSSGVITDTWTITEQTLTGSLQGSDWDYSRLQWCPSRNAYLWRGPNVTTDMQLIRPTDV